MRLRHVRLLLAATCCLLGCQELETAYQRDTDQTRIRHLRQIAELAETFKEHEGHYPYERLEDGSYRTFRLVRGMQLQPMPDDHDDLVELMQQGIAEPLSLPYDPQNVAAYTNRFYAYWSDGQRYTISARLGASSQGATRQGPYHVVYTIESNEEAREPVRPEGEAPPHGTDAVAAAARAGDIERVKELLDAGADVNAPDAEGVSPLHAAVFASYNVPQLEMVQFLLDKGADVNATTRNGLTALHIAANRGHKGLVEILADAGADLDAELPPSVLWELEGKNALYTALQNGDDELAELLAAKGAELDIFTASALGRTERMEELLEADPRRINGRSMHRFTPLHWAAVCGRRQAAELLLRRGADVTARDTNGQTPLDCAVGLGHGEVASLLRAHADEPG